MPFRNYVTPSALWTAVAFLSGAIGYIINAQHELQRHQESIASLQAEHTALQMDRAKDRELMEKIDMQLAVMAVQLASIADEVDRQRDWREHLADIAEAPPHAKRRGR